MKKIAFIMFLYLICQKGISQDLYFITGHPFKNISTQFPSIVYKYQGDTLYQKLQISNEDLLLYFIKVYPELHIVTALTSEYKTRQHQETLHIIHTDRPDSVHRIKINLPENMQCSHSNLIYLSQSKIFECYDCFDAHNFQKIIKDRIVKVYGWNVYNLTKQELIPQDYINTVITGTPASALEGWDYINLYSNAYNGQLVIPETPDPSKRPLYPYILPDSLQIHKERLLSIESSNEFLSSICYNHSECFKNEIGWSNIWVLDKSMSKWFSFQLKGTNINMRCFGFWLTGSVASHNENITFDSLGRVKEKVEFDRISPGKEYRRQKGTSLGTPFDFRTNFNKLYYPGILYVLNAHTQKYIEWNTGQGDSEIILLQDGIIYYRINDEIYKRPIIEGKELGPEELLIKDPRVPDIHWAFLSQGN